jgi:hypothetical protein
VLENLPLQCGGISSMESQEAARPYEQRLHAPSVVGAVVHFGHKHVQVCLEEQPSFQLFTFFFAQQS